ncbi:MAG: glucose-6-phosphate isomerase [Verrucomicrobia bacterium]|nr:glucose-6-phosphate isomerase [Verrucomicrobiota bacterium]MCF7708807.1 glucose-6-phosphate isomerase [Verrucomicrobiota bacterium]
MSANNQLWEKFKKGYTEFSELGLSIDLSRMNYDDAFLLEMEGPLKNAFDAMDRLEKGEIANVDEKRMVGHYWLRNSSLSPTEEIREDIENTRESIKKFAKQLNGNGFKNILIIGIGGSALGPQFVADALGHPKDDKVKVFFFDNTDPDGMDLVMSRLEPELSQTMCIVISKSGSTMETRNGLIEAETAYRRARLNFAQHAVAITGRGSELDEYAKHKNWIDRFPMWDWVGGRTSVTSAVGLLPAALQGIDIEGLLSGARECDKVTRSRNLGNNPAAQLAVMWYFAGGGRGAKDMVIIPYKDRLSLFSRYLQQLIMESLGKEKDLEGNIVNQGISVYGNKGSTDQHAYIQQLRDGLNNFFVTFVEVLKDREGHSVEVEDKITSGDYLEGFFLGTRDALYENGRQSITLTINDVSSFTVGVLIALFERAVGLYASLINVNAYNQPGVEAGKKAAEKKLQIQRKVINFLRQESGREYGLDAICEAIEERGAQETVYKICRHLAANPYRGIEMTPKDSPFDSLFKAL